MKRYVQITVGLLLAVLLMALLLRGVKWGELYASFWKMHMGWLLLAQVPIWLSFFFRILRWTYIVRAVKPATFRSMFSSTQLAFLVNFTIGMRLGELVRPLVLSRLSKLSFSQSLAVNALDRVTDLIGLLVVMLVTAFAFRPTATVVLPAGTFGIEAPFEIHPSVIVGTGRMSAIVLIGVIVLFVLLYVNQRLVVACTQAVLSTVSKRFAAWVCAMIEQFAQGLHVFRSAGDMTKSISWSLATWACFLIVYACMFEAFAMDWPWYAPFVVQVLVAFAVSAPGVPGMVGQFHIPIVVGMLMSIPGVSLADSILLAMVVHASNMLPILVLGMYCMYREGFSFFELSTDSVEIEEELLRAEEERAESEQRPGDA
ncbi:MAG: hypothetical protein AMXMBFR4_21100 [Candidatus Hydrogenedentota bacterium]